MLQLNMTHHAKTDRLDRLVLCVENFGMGEFIAEHYDMNRQATRKLTDTGMMLVLGKNGELVTGYMATTTQIKDLYCKLNKIPPSWILRTARNNQQKMYKLKG